MQNISTQTPIQYFITEANRFKNLNGLEIALDALCLAVERLGLLTDPERNDRYAAREAMMALRAIEKCVARFSANPSRKDYDNG